MTVLREDAEILSILGVRVYAFGLLTALGLALALGLLALLTRKGGWEKGTAPLTGALAMLLGFLVARLFFGWMEGAMGRALPPWAMLLFNTGGYSVMGALLGACMGAVLSARLSRQSAPRLLDILAPALLLFIACERLGEGYISGYGVSRRITVDALRGSFLSVELDDDWRLRTYLLEAVTALVLCGVTLRDLRGKRRAGNTFLLFLLLFGASQILMESLRYDGHMTVKAFVRLEMIMAMLLLSAALIVLAVRVWKRKKALAICAFLSIPAVTGLGVELEFMIDHSGISHVLLYLCYIVLLIVPVGLGLWMRKEGERGKA